VHLNLKVVAPFSAVAALLLTTVARADVFDIVRIQHPSPEVEIVQISQPNVKQPTTDYPSVTFMPGDSVVVTATGCVQTGGIGKTWKRYVNPSGGDAERYYFGEIWIPGATGVLVPIAGVINKTLTVPVGTTNAGSHLRLGYTDNNYSDNGYYNHDDGTENQCYGTAGEPAQVTLTITHNAGATGPTTGDVAPFDLFWNQVDDNAIPLEARWGEQLNHVNDPTGHPTGLAGDDTCPTPYKSPCTTQAPELDGASWPNSWFVCDALGGPFNGHANWGPGTYSGTLSWESKSGNDADDDYSINLLTPNADGATEGRPEGYHTEFDSDETIDNFNIDWWTQLRLSAATPGDTPSPEEILNGKFAIVTGLIDLDCAHPCGGELHPVWGLAIRTITSASDAPGEKWAIFVRNWGDEGWCSSDDHQLMLANNQYTVLLPWPSPEPNGTVATSVTFGDSQWEANGTSSISVVNITPGVGIELTFNLPSPDQHGLIDGTLDLQYTYTRPTQPVSIRATTVENSASARSSTIARVLEPETFANAASVDEDRFPSMTAEQLKVYQAHVPPSPSYRVHRLAMPSPHVLTMETWNVLRRKPANVVPTVRAVPYSAKLARDTAKVQAVYAAFGGKVPGFGPLPTGPGILDRPAARPTPR
jgi:hypothetical protein